MISTTTLSSSADLSSYLLVFILKKFPNEQTCLALVVRKFSITPKMHPLSVHPLTGIKVIVEISTDGFIIYNLFLNVFF